MAESREGRLAPLIGDVILLLCVRLWVLLFVSQSELLSDKLSVWCWGLLWGGSLEGWMLRLMGPLSATD